MGAKESKPPLSRRRTRSSSAKEKENAPESSQQVVDDHGGSPSKKPKLSQDDQHMALARAVEAISEEENAAAQVASDGSMEQEAANSSLEVLVTLPNAKVYLMDHDQAGSESVLLASGDLSVIRIVQNGSVVAAIVKLGDELQWPLAKDAPVLKLSESHYIFSLRLPVTVEEDEDEDQPSSEGKEEVSFKSSAEVLNYGVTLPGDASQELLKELDLALESYSSLVPVPALLKDQDEEVVEMVQDDGNQGIAGVKLTTKKKNYYLEQLAPNADDYQSAIAKAIASGSGHIVRGILWVSELIATQIERSGLLMQQHIKPKKKPSKISPKTMKNIRTAKQISRMTETLASGLLSGVVTATESITSSVLKTKPGAALIGLLRGEAAIATLDAFVKVFDALELAGKNVMSRTTLVTCQVVSHRYGDEAAALTKEGLSTAGHVVTTAWKISKIRTAMNPVKASTNPVSLKAAAIAAAEQLKGKKTM
ncbi:senescence/dehydration-associated protein At4g35985, chloroplastic [Selaginella moellendorffii]|nr:senescence/dehydration-associated protein At4g35985, chloroplastic [Selaginella moellendorffii]|eukprot:XP_002992672.2 senescence/dehydration-associated protein At4g35985, chloroplastic [Selaginella moellendorffii]